MFVDDQSVSEINRIYRIDARHPQLNHLEQNLIIAKTSGGLQLSVSTLANKTFLGEKIMNLVG
jgi:hypothetical protein